MSEANELGQNLTDRIRTYVIINGCFTSLAAWLVPDCFQLFFEVGVTLGSAEEVDCRNCCGHCRRDGCWYWKTWSKGTSLGVTSSSICFLILTNAFTKYPKNLRFFTAGQADRHQFLAYIVFKVSFLLLIYSGYQLSL